MIKICKLQKDVDVMGELNATGYRFSFAWSRIIPSMYMLSIRLYFNWDHLVEKVLINVRHIYIHEQKER